MHFLTFIRFSLISSNAILLAMFSASFVLFEFIDNIFNLFTWNFTPDQNYLILESFFSFICVIFLWVGAILGFIYLFFNPIFVKKGWTIKLSKYELVTIIDYLAIMIVLLTLSSIIFLNIESIDTIPEFYSYTVPFIFVFIILPILIFNVATTIDHFCNLNVLIRKKDMSDLQKKDFKAYFLTILLIVIALSFIFLLWGETSVLMIGLTNWIDGLKEDPVGYIFSFVDTFILIAFIFSIFIFVIINFFKHIKKEQEHKLKAIPKYDFFVLLAALTVILIFLISTSVWSLWAQFSWSNINKYYLTLIGLGSVNFIFCFPAFMLMQVYFPLKIQWMYENE